MKIEAIPVGPFQMNCHLVYDEASREGVVIDPGDEIARISSRAKELGLKLTHILLTHGHIDHVAYAEDMHQQLGVPMLLHKLDWDMAKKAPQQAVMFGLPPGPVPQIDGELTVQPAFQAGALEFEIRHAPGHSPGSVLFIHHPSKQVVAGDVVFQGSIGRTDLPGGSYQQLIDAIHSQVLTLPDDYLLFPGHGPSTTVGAERRSNPFLQN